MLWLAAALIMAACIVELAKLLMKTRNKHLRWQAICREEFKKYADRLIDDTETPDQVIKLIMSMAKKETSRSLLWLFVFDVAKKKSTDQERSAMRAIYNTLSPNLRSDYLSLLVAFTFGLTFNNVVLGPVVRNFMFYSVPTKTGSDIGPVAPVGPMIDELI